MDSKIQKELMEIEKANNGFINPHDVVEYARNPKSALHNQFIWDDTEAAERYRLWQARHIISVQVTTIKNKSNPITVRTYLSLSKDRNNDGGYRRTIDIMKDNTLRSQLLIQAKQELQFWRDKFSNLEELAGVYSEIDKLEIERKSVTIKVRSNA